MTTDLVYIVGGEPDSPGRDEMRYSLRSFEQNLRMEIRDVWAVGTPPDWFTGARLPLDPKPDKFANQRASLTAYVNLPGAADRLVVLNDDMYAIEPHDEIVVCRNRNPASRWAAAEQKERRLGSWHRAVIATATWVAETTDTDPWIYEAHTPLLFDTKRLRDALAAYPIGQPFAVGELYPIAGAGPEGEARGNAKVKTESLVEKLALDMPYLSGSPGSWNGPLGEYIRGMFDTPGRYEKTPAPLSKTDPPSVNAPRVA